MPSRLGDEHKTGFKRSGFDKCGHGNVTRHGCPLKRAPDNCVSADGKEKWLTSPLRSVSAPRVWHPGRCKEHADLAGAATAIARRWQSPGLGNRLALVLAGRFRDL